MQHPAWGLILVGTVIAVIGIVWLLAPGLGWLGKLPGDIRWETNGTRVYIPIATCLLLSLLLTAVLWLVRFFLR